MSLNEHLIWHWHFDVDWEWEWREQIFVVCVSNSACGVGCEIVGSRAISCREAGLVHVSLEELLSKCRVSQCYITLLDSGLLK